jgi:hypothetical protein
MEITSTILPLWGQVSSATNNDEKIERTALVRLEAA